MTSKSQDTTAAVTSHNKNSTCCLQQLISRRIDLSLLSLDQSQYTPACV